jgi:hypothetical protein
VLFEESSGLLDDSVEVVRRGDVADTLAFAAGVAALDREGVEDGGLRRVDLVVFELLFDFAGRRARRDDKQVVGVGFEKVCVDAVCLDGAGVNQQDTRPAGDGIRGILDSQRVLHMTVKRTGADLSLRVRFGYSSRYRHGSRRSVGFGSHPRAVSLRPRVSARMS